MCRITRLALTLLFLSSSVLAQDRAVIVKNADRELLHTAHRLGVAPEKVTRARQFLREASELALDLAETEDILRLGHYWIMIDRSDAGEQLRRLLGELAREAGRTSDLSAYQKMTQNAHSWVDRLRLVEPAGAEEILTDWPEAPQQTAEAPSENRRQSRRYDENRLGARLRDDLDGGLQELREMEKDGPYLSVRTRAIVELLSKRRTEEAHALFDETLDLVAAAPPSFETLNALRNLLSMYSRMGDPERIEDLIATWASLANSVEIPGRSRTVDSVDFTSREYYILNTLRSLSQTPELALQSLEHFPELNRKLEILGGLGGYMRSRNRASAARREATAAEKSDLEREIQERSESVRRLDLANADRQVEEIETTLRMLGELEDPEVAGNFFMILAGFYFGLQGELGPEFRRQGLDYVKQIQEERELEPQAAGQRRSKSIDRLEANIYGMWLWSDPAEASLALESLPESTRYRALASYLGNLTQSRFRTWRMT